MKKLLYLVFASTLLFAATVGADSTSPGLSSAQSMLTGGRAGTGPATVSSMTGDSGNTPALYYQQGATKLFSEKSAQGGSTAPEKQLTSTKPADSAKVRLPAPNIGATVTDEPSFIESALTRDSVSFDKPRSQSLSLVNIRQFGYDFFRPDAFGFASLTDVPVGPDYLVGVGDRIVVTIWGSIDGVYELEINRQGEVVLPKVGPVRLIGVPFERLPAVLRTHLAKVFKDFQISVNIGKLRSMKVYVVGDVQQPGDYTISSLSTLLNALAAAGGPTKNGTLRNIQIKRNGQTVETVDLYNFFLRGDKTRDVRLQPGDTIFVPHIGPVAGIAGNVHRAAIYELKGENSLKDLLALADGINPGAYLQRLQIYRLEANRRNIVTDTSLDANLTGKSLDDMAAAIAVQDMDMVKVFPINSALRGYAKLSGYVLRPGDYALKGGMRLKDLLLPDNLLPEYATGIAQVTRLFPPDFHQEVIFVDLKKALSGDESHNLLLQEFDDFRIFSRWEMEEIPMVRVSGEVQKPGEFRLFGNMTVRDLLLLAGNPKRTAYLNSAEITRINRGGSAVTTSTININLGEALQGNPKDNIMLEPYDTLLIRKIPNWAEITESFVTLKGEFVFPGVYPLYKGEKLSSVIKRAGGFTKKAYLPSAKFTRSFLREIQQARNDEILAREEINIAKKQGELSAVAVSKDELDATKASLEGLQKTIAILRNKKAEGRMVIRLLPEEQLPDSEYNFELVGGDTLEVSADPKVVSVYGQVYNPTSFLHTSEESVADYLSKSGGYTRDAEEGDTYIIKSDGSVVSRQMMPFFSSFMWSKPNSGDTIVVPQKIEKTAWMRDIKDITSILGQIALSAGVLIAAGL